MDADWASNVNNRKSTSGFLCMLTEGTVSWSSKKQGSIALSSTEAKYRITAHTTKEIIWLRHLISELHQPLPSPTILYINNQSTIAIIKNPEFHDHIKHIKVRYHFLWQKVENEEINLEYMSTNAQTADMLIKGLSRKMHKHFRLEMGVRHTL